MSLSKTQIGKYIVKRKFLNGLFSIIYDSLKYKVYIKFLFIKIAKIHFSYGKANINFLGLSIFNSRKLALLLLLPVLNEIVKQKTNKDKVDVIAFFYRSGETFLQSYHLQEYFKNQNINNPVFVSNAKYLGDVLKMFCPETEFIKIPQIFFELHFLNINKPDIINSKIRYYELLTRGHFLDLESRAQKSEDIYFYDALKNRMGVKGTEIIHPDIPEESKTKAKKKVMRIDLNRKFIFVAPDAQSNGTLSNIFWQKLAKKFYENGYDVLFNNIPPGMRNSYYKTCFFTLDEARYLTEHAASVIGVRSGLLDVLASAAKSMHCIYMPFTNRGLDLPPLAAHKVQSAFSLKYLPDVNKNNIYEYNAEEIGEEIILQKIFENVMSQQRVLA